jgi:type II secretory pathway component GspD/PulD (secretin)
MKHIAQLLSAAAALTVTQAVMAGELPTDAVKKNATPTETRSITPAKPELFSLDFRKTPLQAALKLLGYQANIRIIVGDSVSGDLSSLVLRDVTAEQALKYIATAANLSFQKIDDKTFAIGENATRELTPATQISVLGDSLLSVEVQNARAADVLRFIAICANIKLTFTSPAQTTIRNFKLEDVSAQRAIKAVAAAAGLECTTEILVKENGNTEIAGFKISQDIPEWAWTRTLPQLRTLPQPGATPPDFLYSRPRIIPPLWKPDTQIRKPKFDFPEPMIIEPPKQFKFQGLDSSER